VRVAAYIHVPDSPYSSVAGAYHQVARHAAARGHQFQLIAPDRFPWLSRVHARWFPLLLPVAVARDLWRRRHEVDAAIFHSYTGWLFNFLNALRARPMPTVTDFHGLEPIFYNELRAEEQARGRDLSPQFRAMHGWLMPKLLKLSCRRSRRVTCLNPAEADYLRRHGWAESAAIVEMPPGAPAAEFQMRTRDYAPVARRLLCVSQWLPTKGTRYLADAFTALVRDGADLGLLCAGTRQTDAALLADFPDDVRPRVRNVPEAGTAALAALYREADIFVHASLSEGASRAQLEAMAAALPIVTTRTSPAVDLLIEGESAVFVPKRDAQALAGAIGSLVPDQTRRERLGRAAAGAAADLSELKHAQVMTDVLEKLCASPS
jgi:glycosyltransferase involved in cell wall biosynthesis